MRILLVAATGRLGAAVGEAPTGRGHEVVSVGRTAGDVRADVADPEQTARDIVTEVAITTDGDEGFFVGSDEVEFLAPVPTGDFLAISGTVTTRRTVQLEAREVIASRYDESPSGADVLAEPVVVVRATGTTVVPVAHSRGPRAQADRPPDPGTPLGRWPRPTAVPADCPAPPRGAAAPPRGGRGVGEGRTDDTRLRSPGTH